MPTLAAKTVREIALENPSSIPVFESLGIDYCCGGQKPLSDACAHVQADVDRVLELLEQAARAPLPESAAEWRTRPLRQLIAHIVETHHGFVRRETPRIEGLLAKVGAKHGVKRPEIVHIERLFLALAQELATHMLKEEQILFPHIERIEQARQSGNPAPPAFFGTVARPIAAMIAEHDDAGALLAQMRELSNNYAVPEDACPTFAALYHALEEFERDLHRHVHLENNILFPRASDMERAQ